MPCYQANLPPPGVTSGGRTSYRTEAECLKACGDGACCQGIFCSIRPQCLCQGEGKTFRGVGTKCEDTFCGCCGGGEDLGNGIATVSVTRTLDVVANSRCACIPFQPPPQEETRCKSQSGLFTQYGIPQTCSRLISGETDDYGSVTGSIGFLRFPCRVYCIIGWPLHPCGGLSSTYYAWPHVIGQSSYSATYYVFLFTDISRELGTVVVSSVSSVPDAPPHPTAGKTFLYGGAMWSVSLELSLA